MNKRQKVALGVGGGLLVLCLLFPPWLVTGYSLLATIQTQERHHAGYASIFVPSMVEMDNSPDERLRRFNERYSGDDDLHVFKVGNRTFKFLQRPQPQVQIDILRLSIQSIVVVIVTAVAFFLLKGP